jgi:hypothetical protein
MASDAWGLVGRVGESSLASKNGLLMLSTSRPVANLEDKKGQKGKCA